VSDLAEITPCYTITFNRTSKHPPERLWRAITDPREVERWMSYPTKIDLRVGGEYDVDFSRTMDGGLDGIIVRIEPERRLAYVWGLSVLEWVIEPYASGSRYKFIHHGQGPGSVEKEAGIAGGWHLWFDALDEHLDGKPPRPEDQALYAELEVAYRSRLQAVLPAGQVR
jgi:uncharacterized protein YndB with AHSA1/START domain